MKNPKASLSIILISACLLSSSFAVFPVAGHAIEADGFELFHPKDETNAKWGIDTLSRWNSLVSTYSKYMTKVDLSDDSGYGPDDYGHDIYMYTIGNPNGGRVMMTGSVHGWEDMGTEAMYYFAEWLLTNHTSASENYLTANCFYFIPIVNFGNHADIHNNRPDRQNDNITLIAKDGFGCDLNRNFPDGFDPQEPWSGGTPASQAETKAVVYALATYEPDEFLDLHFGGGLTSYYYRGSNNTNLINAYHGYNSGNDFSYPPNDGDEPGMAVNTAWYDYGAESVLIYCANLYAPINTGYTNVDDLILHYAHRGLVDDVAITYLFPWFKAAADVSKHDTVAIPEFSSTLTMLLMIILILTVTTIVGRKMRIH